MSDDEMVRRGDVVQAVDDAYDDSFGPDLANVAARIHALPAQYPAVKPLEWVEDGLKLHMDQTMAFSKSYDWGGWECCRKEGYGLGASYIIWPDSIASKKWNLYGSIDGLFITDLNGEDAAKAAAQADYSARILAAITMQPVPDVSALVEALERLLPVALNYGNLTDEHVSAINNAKATIRHFRNVGRAAPAKLEGGAE